MRKTTINPFGEPAVVVQEGFYRFSRNPMYLGMLLVLIGVGLWLGNVLALLLAPAFVAIMTRWYIVREEQLLEDRFGDVYRAYHGRVRRWVYVGRPSGRQVALKGDLQGLRAFQTE